MEPLAAVDSLGPCLGTPAGLLNKGRFRARGVQLHIYVSSSLVSVHRKGWGVEFWKEYPKEHVRLQITCCKVNIFPCWNRFLHIWEEMRAHTCVSNSDA
jgi:hypothetical protein